MPAAPEITSTSHAQFDMHEGCQVVAAERYREAVNMIDHPRFNQKRELAQAWIDEAEKLLISCRLNEAMCQVHLARISSSSPPSSRAVSEATCRAHLPPTLSLL